MDSLDLCLPKALSKLNLLEQYKLNTLVHKWRDVVGDVIADHTKIVSIKPPDMVISADNSMWMQELQMQKRRIIESINKYYHQEVIKDIRFIMKRQSYVKANTDTSISLPDEQIITKRINFADIVLSKEDVEAIDKSLEQTDNEELRAAFRKVQITAHSVRHPVSRVRKRDRSGCCRQPEGSPRRDRRPARQGRFDRQAVHRRALPLHHAVASGA